jgi:hypothetical protein
MLRFPCVRCISREQLVSRLCNSIRFTLVGKISVLTVILAGKSSVILGAETNIWLDANATIQTRTKTMN